MENEERIPVKAKKAWQTPEIIDLDVESRTEAKNVTAAESASGLTTFGPS